MKSRTFGFFALLSIAAVESPSPAFAKNEALRGKTAMSVYVSVYGDNEIYGAGMRLSIEQQLHDIGITVLPHRDPPNYPVLNLKIEVKNNGPGHVRDEQGRVTETLSTVTFTSKLELRQLAPGRTLAMRPIEDVAIWALAGDTQTVGAIDSWQIGSDALDLAIAFVKNWVSINGLHAATADVPMPLPNPNAPSPQSSEPGQPLHDSGFGGCDRKEGGGCVVEVSMGVTGSIYDLAPSLQEMAIQQIEDQKKRHQMVITCEYGPSNLQTGLGFAVFHFWYKSAPPDILKILTSAYPHPFMEMGRVAVSACPATRAAASVVKATRLN